MLSEKKPYLKKNRRFINPHIQNIRRGLWDVILWKTGYYDDPHEVPLLQKAPASFTYPLPPAPFNPELPSAMWINHSTTLIQIDGINILTDPIWSDRCSPFSFLGPKRRHEPSVKLEELPIIDYVLISHNHYDHLDRKSVLALHALYPEITWFVPTGVKRWFTKLGISQVIECAWWEEGFVVSKRNPEVSLRATAVPAQHFSGRGGTDLNRTLWAGWVVEVHRAEGKALKRLYFVGDTGYNPYDFKQIGEHWKEMDLSLIPIGTYVPKAFMSPVHIGPVDSVKIHSEVHSKLSLGIHWKTFNLSDEASNRPPYDLFLEMQKAGLDPRTFLGLEPGTPINW